MQKTTLYSFSEQRLKQYGYHVLEKRAIPDYRDGLKPVQRHILWSMYKLGMHNDKPYHKAARVVGETISKYHPHGDSCVYQAMVNMAGAINPDAQSSKDVWNNTNTNVPLIEGMGNWGTLLDSAASYRYCLPSDTKIYTDKGIVTFEDLIDINENLKIGEPIYLKEELKTPSLNSKYEPITYCVYSGEHELVEVRTENAPSIRCTKNHPFLTVTKTGFEWVEAQYLTLDHTVCVTSNVCNVVESNVDPDSALILGLIIGYNLTKKDKVQQILKQMFTASNSAVCSFLSGIFDCKSLIFKNKVLLFSSSLRLCEDIQHLLLYYLGIVSNIAYVNDNYTLCIKNYEDLNKLLSNISFLTRSKIKKSNVLLRRVKNKVGNVKHKQCKRGYIYSKVKSVKELNKKSKVYDLHIKTTNAFTANGYIVHNTECKLSKYADRYLLDSDYINAVPFIKNFDGKETLPLYLPSKVPNLLINGSAAIAFGVSIDCPSFSFQSV